MSGSRPRRAVAAAVALGLAVALAACGVEVPDDVAARATSTSTTTEPAPTTTDVPSSDDDLEQALIDNGYTLAEARCGAENLRTELDEDEIREIIGADTIEDIDPGLAADFARALQGCVEDGADEGSGGDGGEGGDGGSDDGDESAPGDDEGPGAGLPDVGDDGEGPVSRSRLLSGLLAVDIPDEVARCIVEEVFARFDQDTIDALFRADAAEELPADVVRQFQGITVACA